MDQRESQAPNYVPIEGRMAPDLNDLTSNLPVHSAIVEVKIPLWESGQSQARPIRRIG